MLSQKVGVYLSSVDSTKQFFKANYASYQCIASQLQIQP